MGHKRGWSKSGHLKTGDTAKKVSMQANFEEGPNGPGQYTVEFSLTPPPNQFFNASAEAVITWSVEGNSVSRRVSVGNGVSVSGVGAACSVVVIDTTPVDDPTMAYEFEIGIQVAPGSRPSGQSPPILLLRNPTVTTAGNLITALYQIPQDAGGKSALVVTGVSGNTQVPNDGNLTCAVFGNTNELMTWDPRVFSGWLPLPPGATAISVQTNYAFGIFKTVYLGIDG